MAELCHRGTAFLGSQGGSGPGWLQPPSFSAGCVPKEHRRGGSSQLDPSHGHSLAGLQVTPKAALCKQEMSGSHWDSSEMRLGLDNGASRHPRPLGTAPQLPPPSPSSLCGGQGVPPKCNGGATGQQQSLEARGKNPFKGFRSTPATPRASPAPRLPALSSPGAGWRVPGSGWSR